MCEQRGTGVGPAGSGDLSPASITVPAGALSGGASFTARSPGRVVVRASSAGIAPGEDLLSIVGGAAASTFSWLFPVVEADSAPAIEVHPRTRSLPLNGLSTAPLWVLLDRPLGHGEALRVRLITDPPVPMQHRGEKTVGFADVELKEGEDRSDPVELLPSELGRVRVFAQGGGAPAHEQATVDFVAPLAVQIMFDPDQQTIRPHQSALPLAVRVADQDGIKIRTLATAHEIEVVSASDDSTVSFDPRPIFTLAPGHAAQQITVGLRSLPPGGELHLLARDKEGDLATGFATLLLQSPLPVVSAVLLVFLAGLGGTCGGLVRHVYKVGSPNLWPQRGTDGQLQPGLVLNTISGALFGVVLFQAFDFGLVQLGLATGRPESPGIAFFFGVLGGFGGVYVLERLVDGVLLFPKRA